MLPTTLTQIFCQNILIYKIISNSIIEPGIIFELTLDTMNEWFNRNTHIEGCDWGYNSYRHNEMLKFKNNFHSDI